MIRKYIIFFIIILFFNACEEKDKKLKIAVSTWIGYTPLFYAKEKGWLEDSNIKLLNVVSLTESMYLYKSGAADSFVGTQYEYNLSLQKDKTLFPLIMFDRSNGGDLVMANKSILELQNSNETIDTYLEIDSINSIVLKDFIKKNLLDNKKINYKNHDQSYISQLNIEKITNPTIVITYVPYNLKLRDKGFQELLSTKDNLDLIVVDALFTTKETFNTHKKQFHELKFLIDKALINLENNPKEYYDKIKGYLLETSYKDFLSSLNDIVWTNKNISKELAYRLRESNFPTRNLIK